MDPRLLRRTKRDCLAKVLIIPELLVYPKASRKHYHLTESSLAVLAQCVSSYHQSDEHLLTVFIIAMHYPRLYELSQIYRTQR